MTIKYKGYEIENVDISKDGIAEVIPLTDKADKTCISIYLRGRDNLANWVADFQCIEHAKRFVDMVNFHMKYGCSTEQLKHIMKVGDL